MNSTPSDFWEWIVSLQSGERLALLIGGLFAVVFVVTMVLGTIGKMYKNRLDATLKRDLLERGMSADEIATVIQAKSSKAMGCGQGK
jgi:hypothetical protein